ncbi:MAG: DNA polymerase-3 subunit beta [Alteromonadaceae bacterium]|jgi:DNA polymerase-3 subunit beta
MNFTINRDDLLKPLVLVSGAIERRHTMPVLSNVLIEVSQGRLSLTGTDLEVELVATSVINDTGLTFRTTVPAKKLLDICKSLPDSVQLNVQVEAESMVIKAGKSRFTLSTLSADEYPNLDHWDAQASFELKKSEFRGLIESTHFAMANQDVRYYLNGMFLEVENNIIRTVSTDGHRLALSSLTIDFSYAEPVSIIIPRKGIMEVLRLIPDGDELVVIDIGTNHIRITDNDFTFTSKLVDGRFPDYRRVMPLNGDKFVVARRDVLKDAFHRVSILSNERFRGVRLNLTSGELHISANNPEQEQAEEAVDVQYEGIDLELGFNVSYLLDVLNNLRCEEVQFTLIDSISSVLIQAVGRTDLTYVVMPMRL